MKSRKTGRAERHRSGSSVDREFEPEHLEAKHLLQRQSTLLVGTDGSNSEVAQFRTQQYAHCFDVDSGGGICILRVLHHRPVVAS